ncbi:PD-(D/E)XK nuclease family protein [Kineosporia rhizophila]|nr:PD-(D/E)XK nuclease family protein [Kineosporia rhizophila]MCE0538437.1 PD-(D/E)XK nuclease family protein [Kineosporia rhizophila]
MAAALSPSRASDFMQCPLLYRFRVVDRLPERPSPAALRGTVVHTVLESLFDLPAEQRTLQAARDLLQPSWEKVLAERPEAAQLFGGPGPGGDEQVGADGEERARTGSEEQARTGGQEQAGTGSQDHSAGSGGGEGSVGPASGGRPAEQTSEQTLEQTSEQSSEQPALSGDGSGRPAVEAAGQAPEEAPEEAPGEARGEARGEAAGGGENQERPGAQADLEAWLASASELIGRWFALEDPTRLEPADRELYVETTLDNDLVLRGYVDRLDVAADGRLRVVDYKTGRSPGEAFEAKALFQMKFYALVLWRTRGRLPTVLQLVYLGNGEILRYEPDEQDLLAVERKVKALWEAIALAAETGDWRPSPSRLCTWCDHHALCPAKGGTPPPIPPEARARVLGITPEEPEQPVGSGVPEQPVGSEEPKQPVGSEEPKQPVE